MSETTYLQAITTTLAQAMRADERVLVLGEDVPPEVRQSAFPSEAFRGAISRIAISRRTGLPRETVRRKTNMLLRSGFLSEDQQGAVRTTRNLADSKVQKAADDGFSAVRKYDARLRQLGCQPLTEIDS